MSARPSFAAIVPCCNEAGTIEACARSLLAIDQLDTIVLVDDGSCDGTTRLCARLSEDFGPRVKSLILDGNHGKGYAVWQGAQSVDAEILVVFDADLTVDATAVADVLATYVSGSNFFVYGSRFSQPMEPHAMPALRVAGNRLFAAWVSILLKRRISDVLCGLKAFPRRIVNLSTAPSCRWGDFALVFSAADHGLDFREVPVRYRRRRSGASKLDAWHDGWSFVGQCTRRMLRLE